MGVNMIHHMLRFGVLCEKNSVACLNIYRKIMISMFFWRIIEDKLDDKPLMYRPNLLLLPTHHYPTCTYEDL